MTRKPNIAVAAALLPHHETTKETTKPHLASSRSKFKQENQRLAGEQAMRDYKAAQIEQEGKTEKLRELRLRFLERNADSLVV